MKKNLFFLFLLPALFCGCSANPDNIPPEPGTSEKNNTATETTAATTAPENEENEKGFDDTAPKSMYTLAYQSVLMSDTGEAQGELIWFASPGAVTSPEAYYVSSALGTGNIALFTKVLTKTCEKSTGVSLIGKEIKSSTVTVTESQMHTFVIVACGIIPVAIIAIGIVVWALRRRK